MNQESNRVDNNEITDVEVTYKHISTNSSLNNDPNIKSKTIKGYYNHIDIFKNIGESHRTQWESDYSFFLNTSQKDLPEDQRINSRLAILNSLKTNLISLVLNYVMLLENFANFQGAKINPLSTYDYSHIRYPINNKESEQNYSKLMKSLEKSFFDFNNKKPKNAPSLLVKLKKILAFYINKINNTKYCHKDIVSSATIIQVSDNKAIKESKFYKNLLTINEVITDIEQLISFRNHIIHSQPYNIEDYSIKLFSDLRSQNNQPFTFFKLTLIPFFTPHFAYNLDPVIDQIFHSSINGLFKVLHSCDSFISFINENSKINFFPHLLKHEMSTQYSMYTFSYEERKINKDPSACFDQYITEVLKNENISSDQQFEFL